MIFYYAHAWLSIVSAFMRLLEGELLTSDTKDNFWSKEDWFFSLRIYITSRNESGLEAQKAACQFC